MHACLLLMFNQPNWWIGRVVAVWSCFLTLMQFWLISIVPMQPAYILCLPSEHNILIYSGKLIFTDRVNVGGNAIACVDFWLLCFAQYRIQRLRASTRQLVLCPVVLASLWLVNTWMSEVMWTSYWPMATTQQCTADYTENGYPTQWCAQLVRAGNQPSQISLQFRSTLLA